ncbi:DUF7793 family protein [Galbibacter mesophilus]|uniref:DUF7793 family protein n=1 Tax=Galbibacter mesophilus TaxID=379069 RepID=UPI00191D7CE1|nr:hypothetical protein [Galbibacter mesophilus]MCM5663653.1 hypothetical protein [Galbibacter mesophilus]
MEESMENDYANLWIKDGILYFKYKDHVHIDLKKSIEIVSARLALQKGLEYPILSDITGVRELSKDARSYLASEGSVLSKAVAFVTNRPVSGRISKMFVENYRPSVPVKICNSTEEAITFLKTFVDD